MMIDAYCIFSVASTVSRESIRLLYCTQTPIVLSDVLMR